jgi:hypothetical protein
VPTQLARRQIASLRGKAKASLVLAVDDILPATSASRFFERFAQPGRFRGRMDRCGAEHLAYLGKRRTRDWHVIDRCFGIDNVSPAGIDEIAAG